MALLWYSKLSLCSVRGRFTSKRPLPAHRKW